MSIVGKLLTRHRAALDDVRGSVEQVRVDLISAEDQLAEVRRTPAPRKRADEAVEAAIADCMSRAADAVTVSVEGGRMPVIDLDLPASMVLDVAIALNPGGFREFMAVKIDRLYRGAKGLSDAERKDKITRLTGEIERLELLEESLIRASEDAGLPILRRRDARPEVVLADDSAMPT